MARSRHLNPKPIGLLPITRELWAKLAKVMNGRAKAGHDTKATGAADTLGQRPLGQARPSTTLPRSAAAPTSDEHKPRRHKQPKTRDNHAAQGRSIACSALATSGRVGIN